MNKKTVLPFSDLKENGVVKKVNGRFTKGNNVVVKSFTDSMQKVSVDFEPTEYFMKSTSTDAAFASVASSQMYNNIGINTPPIFMLDDFDAYSAHTLQQDVHDFKDALVTLASTDLEYAKIEKKFFSKFKWQMFYDATLIQEFLKYMTPDCLEQLQNAFLVDEMRTDIDRLTKNYFFYKSPDSDKYEGIIVIDLDLMVIFNYGATSKDEFDAFILYPYQSATPQQVNDELCFKQRVDDIRELMHDGVLSSGNVNAIKSALSYDLSKSIKTAMKGKIINPRIKNKIITPVDRLWEYNRKTIGKDLGL